MVDLRESLQPAGSATPLPISEIAARAGRRRRRRLATITTAALLAMAGTATLIVNSVPRSNTAVVADAAEPAPSTMDEPGPTDGADTSPATTGPAATEADSDDAIPDETTPGTTAEEDTVSADTASTGPDRSTGDSASSTGADPSETDGLDSPDSNPADIDTGDLGTGGEPSTTPGLRTETTTTSQWEDGYCVEIEVNNEGETAARAWQVVLDLDGTIATLWSASIDDSTDGRFVFSGVAGYNATLDAGALTTFGACLDLEAG